VTTFRACSSPAPTPVKPQPAPAILSQESVHTTLSITHHTRKRPSTGPRTTHGPQAAGGAAADNADVDECEDVGLVASSRLSASVPPPPAPPQSPLAVSRLSPPAWAWPSLWTGAWRWLWLRFMGRDGTWERSRGGEHSRVLDSQEVSIQGPVGKDWGSTILVPKNTPELRVRVFGYWGSQPE
jgi:hypothetical protein